MSGNDNNCKPAEVCKIINPAASEDHLPNSYQITSGLLSLPDSHNHRCEVHSNINFRSCLDSHCCYDHKEDRLGESTKHSLPGRIFANKGSPNDSYRTIQSLQKKIQSQEETIRDIEARLKGYLTLGELYQEVKRELIKLKGSSNENNAAMTDLDLTAMKNMATIQGTAEGSDNHVTSGGLDDSIIHDSMDNPLNELDNPVDYDDILISQEFSSRNHAAFEKAELSLVEHAVSTNGELMIPAGDTTSTQLRCTQVLGGEPIASATQLSSTGRNLSTHANSDMCQLITQFCSQLQDIFGIDDSTAKEINTSIQLKIMTVLKTSEMEKHIQVKQTFIKRLTEENNRLKEMLHQADQRIKTEQKKCAEFHQVTCHRKEMKDEGCQTDLVQDIKCTVNTRIKPELTTERSDHSTTATSITHPPSDDTCSNGLTGDNSTCNANPGLTDNTPSISNKQREKMQLAEDNNSASHLDSLQTQIQQLAKAAVDWEHRCHVDSEKSQQHVTALIADIEHLNKENEELRTQHRLHLREIAQNTERKIREVMTEKDALLVQEKDTSQQLFLQLEELKKTAEAKIQQLKLTIHLMNEEKKSLRLSGEFSGGTHQLEEQIVLLKQQLLLYHDDFEKEKKDCELVSKERDYLRTQIYKKDRENQEQMNRLHTSDSELTNLRLELVTFRRNLKSKEQELERECQLHRSTQSQYNEASRVLRELQQFNASLVQPAQRTPISQAAGTAHPHNRNSPAVHLNKSWQCLACTFRNIPQRAICEMCGSRAPYDPSPKVPADSLLSQESFSEIGKSPLMSRGTDPDPTDQHSIQKASDDLQEDVAD